LICRDHQQREVLRDREDVPQHRVRRDGGAAGSRCSRLQDWQRERQAVPGGG
jgi:hypothetical protein